MHRVAYAGDTITFTLSMHSAEPGGAYLRTNIGNGTTRLKEIVEHVERDSPVLARDWHDVPMQQVTADKYSVTAPLTEIGRFEGKTFFLPEGTDEPVWPEGANVVIKVEPAAYCCGNSLYTVFVRQFGTGMSQLPAQPDRERLIAELESEQYSVIPPSGTFRDVIRELDFIVNELRFRILLLLPIHPVPTTYARMGRFGSPFAVMDFMDVDPALAEFDRGTTPMQQFGELVDAVHARGAKLFIDIPINHTGWASHLQITHPEWFARGEDRTFLSPGAWGVTWEDLAKLDYGSHGLWQYMGDVFRFWCSRGVDGFRCDAGYMVPAPVWKYIVAKVRLAYPETVFLLEGLGGAPAVVEDLLDGANLDWAYSELFQNYDRAQIESYVPGAAAMSSAKGTLIHFAETHDNDRLASVSRQYARMRTALSALCAHGGGFGITNGVEWFADEKIDVHEASSLNWGAEESMAELIRRLNTILSVQAGFHAGARMRLIHAGQDNTIALLRQSGDGKASVVVVANLETEHSSVVAWSAGDFTPNGVALHDLLSGRQVAVERRGDSFVHTLAAAEVLCLTADVTDLRAVESGLTPGTEPVQCRTQQRLKHKALQIHGFFHPQDGTAELDTEKCVRDLLADPLAYCARWAAPAAQASGFAPVVSWKWPRDLKRTVMLPPGHFLQVVAPGHFLAELGCGGNDLRREESLPGNDGQPFVLFLPVTRRETSVPATLTLTVFEPGSIRREKASVLLLSPGSTLRVRTTFTRREVEDRGTYALCTNGLGGMAQVRGLWGEIRSQYDALLAGNLHPDFPVDRHIMFTRCRAWLVCRGYSHEIDRGCLERFSVDRAGRVTWFFAVPSCEGKVVRLAVRLQMHAGRNAVSVLFCRQKTSSDSVGLAGSTPARIIVRPDIEDRSAHTKTTANAEIERAWPASVDARTRSFTFSPSPSRTLTITASHGSFTRQPEWLHAVSHPEEADRGLGGSSDLFSPGYFAFELKGGQNATLAAEVYADGNAGEPQVTDVRPGAKEDAEWLPAPAMKRAMRQFIVKRNDLQTVIAGYPWFLDWGRDTLICLRGMIAAGMIDEARKILVQFARFESHGTLPNVIRGQDASNRDTSDAPLWFVVACRDLLGAMAPGAWLLEEDCGGRTLRAVLTSIAENYISGTANGIRVDARSGLVFSPAHFTWMDTNHPAGTPREGYPIEIQSLWYASLNFLSKIEPDATWHTLAEQVHGSINTYYPSGSKPRFLSDCLHARPGQPAEDAVPDDHLRPNQLLAITLGAVDDGALCRAVLTSCEELLVPGAIRSLADRPVEYRLEIQHHGKALNDPSQPYWGAYRGNEDTSRKPAYHNGTAWTWLFPSYCEALFLTYGEVVRDTALALLGSGMQLVNQGCVAQVPEIVDGDGPHALRGCGAQAWGVGELYRVLDVLGEV